ncbi:MAG: Maf family protein [Boseongicola sp.]
MTELILASGSVTRAELLGRAGINFKTEPAHIDENAIKQSLQAEKVSSRDIADYLAAAKARRVSSKHPSELVFGCDQVLEFDGELVSKSNDQAEALDQLKKMRGRRHTLYSAAVFYEDSLPIWRHTGQVELEMRDASDAYLEDYLSRNWESVSDCVGCYKLEEEGVRLFTKVDGNYFNVLGLPLLEILSYLTLRGTLPS